MALRVEEWWWDGALVLTPHGSLDTTTYRTLRDHLTKAGSDEPRAVVVDLRDLEIESGSALSIFTTVHSRLDQWPGVPLMLADGNPHSRSLLAASHTDRYVPVHDDVRAAVAAIGTPSPRRVRRTELGNTLAGTRVARQLVRDACAEWGVTDLATDAALVATELVTNTIMHTPSTPTLRVELRRGLLTVAVSDDVAGDVAIRDPGGDPGGVHGLLLVAQLATAWGCMLTATGKVVWASFRAP